ncbi:hypothetical protein MTO96_042636 [Rhipicephalus appendiculatus]
MIVREAKSAKSLLRTRRKKKPSLAKSLKGLVRTAAAVSPKRRNDAVPTYCDRRPFPRPPHADPTCQLPVRPADRRNHLLDFLPTIAQLPILAAPYWNVPADVYAVMPQTFPANPTPVPNVPPARAQVFQQGNTPMPTASHPADVIQELNNRTETVPICNLPVPRAAVSSPTRPARGAWHSVSWANDINWRCANSGSRTNGSDTGTSSTINALPRTMPSWKKELRAACLALCLASATMISFWAFDAVADVIVAGRDFSDEYGEPITVQPQDDSAIGVSNIHGAFQYGPHRKTEASRFGRRSSMDMPGGILVKNATGDDAKNAL